MNKLELTEIDHKLIKTALAEFNKDLKHDWHGVASAILLKSGEIFTSFVLEAEVSSLTICAEPLAIGKALEKLNNDDIQCIVAVRRGEITEHKVIPPCGRCREFITDYGPYSHVIIFDQVLNKLIKVQANDLLPFKYSKID